jgi:hypothetical protein
MSDTYYRCKWCPNSYKSGTGYNFDLCSKKCQHQYYQAYPDQWKIDWEKEEARQKKNKEDSERFWSWFWVIFLALCVYLYAYS